MCLVKNTYINIMKNRKLAKYIDDTLYIIPVGLVKIIDNAISNSILSFRLRFICVTSCDFLYSHSARFDITRIMSRLRSRQRKLDKIIKTQFI